MGLEDVSKYPALFAALLGTGTWSLDDLKKVAGLNFLRVFREVEKVGPFFVKSILSRIVKPCPSAFFLLNKIQVWNDERVPFLTFSLLKRRTFFLHVSKSQYFFPI